MGWIIFIALLLICTGADIFTALFLFTALFFAFIFYFIGKKFMNNDAIKVVSRYHDLWGNKIKETEYMDTGKKERIMTRFMPGGATITERKIVRKGQKKCHNCGEMVYSDNFGIYRCCGREWR